MLWVKAFHVIFMVTWFAGLFYLPRLFVYHAECRDAISLRRFKTMEHRLFYYITTPGALLTIACGLCLLSLDHAAYAKMMWLHVKLVLVAFLCTYHLFCWRYLQDFKYDRNKYSHRFYRFFNEIPTILLISIIILTIVKPVL